MNINENQQSAEEMLIEDLVELIQENKWNAEMAPLEDDTQYPIGDRAWHTEYLADQLVAIHEDGIHNSDDAWAAWVYYTLYEGLLNPSLTDERYAELVTAAVAQAAAG